MKKSSNSTLENTGWISSARRCISPNQDERPSGVPVELVVIHNISLPPFKYGSDNVEQLFTNQLNPADDPFFATIANLRVSAHFFIRRDGELVQFVSVLKRAWHAGVSSWKDRSNCNDFSIGIELEGCDFEPFSEKQYQALIDLLRLLFQELPLLKGIVGHSDIAPQRKTDPGDFFDWKRIQQLNFPDLETGQ